ncbi:MAG TPA: DUF892 family protein [Saprospiraceae bacterium]|nr:DUF892 family protein [Saprospiraceae bacterium]
MATTSKSSRKTSSRKSTSKSPARSKTRSSHTAYKKSGTSHTSRTASNSAGRNKSSTYTDNSNSRQEDGRRRQTFSDDGRYFYNAGSETQNYYGPGSRLERWSREGRPGSNQRMPDDWGRYGDDERDSRGRYSESRHDHHRDFQYDGTENRGSYYNDGRNDNRYEDDHYRSQPVQRNRSRTSDGKFQRHYSDSQYSRSSRSMHRPHGEESEGLRQLLLEQLHDILWAEQALTKAIPKMIKKASSDELKDALNNHLQETRQQVEKVKEAFGHLGEKPQAKTCEAMKGLIKEAEDIMGEMEDGNILDAAIICAAQKVEHYEIATYGSLATYADILDEQEVAELLGEVLVEEKAADEMLSQIAYNINWAAAQSSQKRQKAGTSEGRKR